MKAKTATPATPAPATTKEDGNKLVSTRDLELAEVRLGEIMIKAGQFVIGDPLLMGSLPHAKVLSTGVGEVLVPSRVDKETGLQEVGGTVVVSSTGMGDKVFPVYAHYKDGKLTKVVIELNRGRWFTPEDTQRQWQEE
jgi:hypothetical protein